MEPQPGILAEPPRAARYLTFQCVDLGVVGVALDALRREADGDAIVVGLGPSLVRGLGGRIEGLRELPHHAGPGFDVPSTPAALWVWLRGDDRGELLHRGRRIEALLAGAFAVESVVEGFLHAGGRDLSGYEDGTENPKGPRAIEAACLVEGPLAGSSFVAVQRWVHDLPRYDRMTEAERDAAVGRDRHTNAELADAPPSAHVKRTAQESFEPAAFVLRRSMPWVEGDQCGLVFVAFGASLDAFEALLFRMVGGEDGIPDALFRFTRPVTGAAFWCPPVVDGRLHLAAIGL